MYLLKSGGYAAGDLAVDSVVFGLAAVSTQQRRLSISRTVTFRQKHKLTGSL